MNYKPQKGSIFVIVILLIAVIAVLGYFGISVQRDIVGNPTVSSNFTYVANEITTLWNLYLKDAATALWHWAVVNITNLPVGSGNGIQIPQITAPLSPLPPAENTDSNQNNSQ